MARDAESFDVVRMLERGDLDVNVNWPEGLLRVSRQGITKLLPWDMLPRELAQQRLIGLRNRFGSISRTCADERARNEGHVCTTHVGTEGSVSSAPKDYSLRGARSSARASLTRCFAGFTNALQSFDQANGISICARSSNL